MAKGRLSQSVCLEKGKVTMKKRYNVWITDQDGKRSLLSYRNRTSWTFKTAIKYAFEFVDLHECLCTVVVEED